MRKTPAASTVQRIRLNTHLELNATPPVNNNPSLGLVPNLGFIPGDTRRVKLNVEDMEDEESADECDVTGDCEI
jgi:hypothetical protein